MASTVLRFVIVAKSHAMFKKEHVLWVLIHYPLLFLQMLIAAFVTVAADAEGSEVAAGLAVAAISSRRFFEIKIDHFCMLTPTTMSLRQITNITIARKWLT